MKKMLVPIRSGSVKFFIIVCLFALWANPGHATDDQNYRKMNISLNVKDENLEQVLNKIAELAKVQFFYNHSLLDMRKKITLDLKKRSLEDVISYVLGGQDVTIEFQLNRTIVIKPKPKMEQTDHIIKISGKVIDSKTKEPLPGASIVMAERKAMGVVTNELGQFFIEVPVGISALSISFIGYESESLPLNKQENYTDIIIKMSQQIVQMEDVVVTGMAPRKVESFTGTYVTVKGETLKKLNPNNLLKALQIFDPSFRIVENNSRGSDPNTLPEFNLRGDVQLGTPSGSSMEMLLGDYSNRPNMPLFILNGFETTLQQIVDLDPERVESITILKDASATAIYGSRAANGVVVFETKKPLPGALNISYSANIGISIPDLTDYNMMNAEEKLQYEWDAKLFNPMDPEQMNTYNHYRSEVLQGVNTYWLSAPLRVATTHRHSLSMEGGDEALRYSFGLNYGQEGGVMKESDRRSMGLNLNLQYRRKKWNISNQLGLMDAKGNNTSYGSFSDYTRLNPYYRKTDENGNYTRLLDNKFVGTGEGSWTIINPLYNTRFPHKDMNQNFSVSDNISIECALLENLRISAQGSISKGIAKSEVFKSRNHTDFVMTEDLTKQGSYNKNIANSFSWSVNAAVSYNLTIDKHLLSFQGRWSMTENVSDGVNLSAKGFPNDNMTDFLFAYEMEQRVRGSESTTRNLGILGQVNYMYDYRFAVDFSIRGDLSSRFGANTPIAPFWSTGFRWNVHKEKWLENTFLKNLVLSGSYGVTGAQNYSPYQSIETYSFGNLLFPYLSSDVLGAELMGFGNPDLGWSTTTNRSLNMDMGFWNNRINMSFRYYNDYTDELLLDYNISPSSGFGSMMANAGAVENSGYELMFNITPINDYERGIQWSIAWNGSHNRNRIKKISNLVKKMNEDNLNRSGAPLPIYEEGKSRTQLFAVRSLGIDPATGKEVFLKRNGEKTFIWDPVDKIPLGDTEPKLRGAVSSTLTWKNLSVSVACSYELGADRYNSTLVDKIENLNIAYNLDRRAAQERWHQAGDIVKYKSMSLLGQGTQTSSRFLEKFNEFRISSIAAGYRLEQKNFKFLQACRIASLSMNVSTQDIARFATVKEERGLDYPFARSFNFSLSVLFN